MCVSLIRWTSSWCTSHIQIRANVVVCWCWNILSVDCHTSWTMNIHIRWECILLIPIVCISCIYILWLTRFTKPCPCMTWTLSRSAWCCWCAKIFRIHRTGESICCIVSGQIICCVCTPRAHTSTQISCCNKILLNVIRSLNYWVFSTTWG